MKQVVVTEYDSQWPATFERLRDRIWPVVSEHALRVEHVGSTSVPWLAAKPIIDMTIVLRDRSDIPVVIDALVGLGYKHRGDLGVTGREAFHQPAGLPEHHLYLCVHGTLALRNHVAVRDLLRADPEAAQAYSDLKKSLARRHPDDIDAYIAGKTSMLLGLLERAGIDERDRAEIEKINVL